MNRAMAVKLTLALSVMSVQAWAQDAILKVPTGTELMLKPLVEQVVTEPTEISVQPLLANEGINWPEHCLLSLTISPGETADFTPGNMVCITAERQIIEAVPEGNIELGQCVASQTLECATLDVTTEQNGSLRLTAPLELQLQPRNLF